MGIDPAVPTATTRRALFSLGAVAASAAALAACDGQTVAAPDEVVAVEAFGTEQAGIVRPLLPQPSLLSQVWSLRGAPGPLLRTLGDTITALTKGSLLGVVPPGDLTITVGVGPRLVRLVGASLPGAEELPHYGREDLIPNTRGGDLWVQLCGSNPLVVSLASTSIAEVLTPSGTLQWSQRAWRGSYEQTPDGHQAGRNVMGFQDGIVAPRAPAELADGVWIAGDSRLVGATIAVVRRFRLDVSRWRKVSTSGQEAAVGRSLVSSRPLSGGTAVDLGAKAPDGAYVIPADAHVRRAHPTSLGLPVMLRRSYSIDEPDPGLLFISFQSTLRAFTATMDNLDASDQMMTFATTTASGTFLVLPGYSAARPLGSSLFGT